MKQEKYPVEKIIQILSEAELPGGNIADVCQRYGISRGTFERCRKKYKGFSSDEARRLKVLEDDNMRLKRFLQIRSWNYRCSRILFKKTSDHI